MTSIFIKHSNVSNKSSKIQTSIEKEEKIKLKINKKDLVEKIFKYSYTTQNNNLRNKMMFEVRCRIFKMTFTDKITKEFIEISYASRNDDFKKRLYLNNEKKWIETKTYEIFEKYVVEEYYYYTDNANMF
jgi:hypothetical protein